MLLKNTKIHREAKSYPVAFLLTQSKINQM